MGTPETWTERDAMELRDTIGELRLRYGGQWAYFELARLLPVYVTHEIVALAREGMANLADGEIVALRSACKQVLEKRGKA